MLSESGKLQVSVEDTGIGIPPDKLQAIFDTFGKMENIELNPQGCGLGLSISSMILQKLGGETIYVKSTPHKGSTFSFQISIFSEEREKELVVQTLEIEDELIEIPAEYVVVANPNNGVYSSSFAKILIVDDAPFNRLVLRKILETAGYSYAEASTGLEAVSMVRAAWDRESPYSVVLMDVEMPEMDGITATRELLGLAASGLLGSVPVIIGCSAFSSEEDRAAALAAGMTHYLEKPVSRGRLLELVSEYYHP
jgi:CheY-like chemotaxis protein